MINILDRTFALRLLNFATKSEFFDAPSEEERDSFIRYAKKLLQYQCINGSESDIEYLKNLGVYDEYNKAHLKTEDGFSFYEYLDSGNDTILYSCMKNPKSDETIVKNKYFKIKINNKRVYFVSEEECLKYLIMNTPIYSRKDVEELLKNNK